VSQDNYDPAEMIADAIKQAGESITAYREAIDLQRRSLRLLERVHDVRSLTLGDSAVRADLSTTVEADGRTLVHLLGYYGDSGENLSVLSVTTDLSPGDAFPETGRIFIGTPQKSPLLEGYFPNLGAFSCSPDAADRLADELRAASARAREAMARARKP
jgi:hypothetical protein